MRLTGAFVLVLGIFVFAGSALAGNGHGNGNGNGNDGAPGNSASAPGQVKKDAPSASTVTTTTTPTAPATTTTTTVADQPADPTEGVKPSNETAHNTHAAASSDKTKKYGNSQTAGAIAIKHGAPPSTVLHGPGNSQPHKAAPCSGGHEVDVHALKGRHTAACGHTPPQPGPVPTPKPTPTPPAPPVDPTNPPTPGHPPTTPPSDPAGGNKSGEAGGKTVSHTAGRSAGVLAAAGQAAELPFTGLSLWLVVAGGLLLIAAGITLRRIRTVDAAVESGHDHTNRSGEPARRARSTVGGRSSR